MNLSIAVMGEVANPGRYNIDKDNPTILDALSQAGDLTIFGKREKVLVLRNEDGRASLYIPCLLPATERCSLCRTE